MTRRNVTVSIRRLEDREDDSDIRSLTPAERMDLAWRISVDTWAFMGDDGAEFRLPRHVVRVVRSRG